MSEEFKTIITNVLVIGSGGAGLRAAVEVSNLGLSVNILGKRPKADAHTSLAAGGINAAFANLDKQDSWRQHFADTYIEGYGIGDPRTIELMTKEAPTLVEEIDKWGSNFDRLDSGEIDQRFFGAHTYRRTCYSADSTGKAILNTLLNKIKTLDISLNDTQYVTEILVKGGVCFGAFSFDIVSGEKTLYLADAVILATGGTTGIWERSSSRKDENNGDGIYLAIKAGCKMVDMEMIQFHPTGMLYPKEIAGTLVTEAVRGEGGKLFNIKGERFMINYDIERMELSTRDKVAKANYTEIINGRGTKNGGVFLDITHIGKELIMKKLPTIYRQFIEYQMLDISQNKMEVAPTAHYSMGGISVMPEDHSTCIKGLYACGEVAGGLHGANRLGGNSLAEILVFGKRAGIAAAKYSKNLSHHIRDRSIINSANAKINASIKKGSEIGRKLEYEIKNLMWTKCGVIRNKKQLNEALSKLKEIKEKFKNIDVRVREDDFQELVIFHNVQSSLCSAEATILSALSREESIGSHQRDDFPNFNTKKVNYFLKMNDDKKLLVSKKNCPELSRDLLECVKSTSKINSFKGRLIE